MDVKARQINADDISPGMIGVMPCRDHGRMDFEERVDDRRLHHYRLRE